MAETMNSKERLVTNATMSLIQVVVVSATLFILYRFILNTLGIVQFGVFSLVLAAASVTQVAGMGLSTSVVKYVAKYTVQGDKKSISELIQTAFLATTLFYVVLLIPGYPLIQFLLYKIVPAGYYRDTVSILPYAFFSFWVMAVTGVIQSGLDGFQRIDQRSMLMMGGGVLSLVLSVFLAPSFGLVGLAWARVLQNIAVLFASWVLLRRYVAMPFIPFLWNKALFREMFAYGAASQAISVTTIFGEPLTKAILTKFGGLGTVGYYEMSSKLAFQLRSFLMSANQAIVPVVSVMYEEGADRIRYFYVNSLKAIFFLSLPAFSLLAVSAPLISVLWLGHYEKVFVVFTLILAFGTFLSALSGPAYFTNMGTGHLKWNVIGHVASVAINVVFGIILGSIFGGTGVVIAFAMALITGSAVIYIPYHMRARIDLTGFMSDEKKFTLSYGAAIAAFAAMQIFLSSRIRPLELGMLEVCVFALVTAGAFWRHPMRARLAELFYNGFALRFMRKEPGLR